MSTPEPRSRVLLIALDAAEASLVEAWTAAGRLPNLARLTERGAYGRLASSADWLAGSIWPTFHTGTLPGDHGHHHFLQWHRERMTLLRPSGDWLPQRVFWRDAAAAGRRVVAVDVPSVYAVGPINGVEITGWSNTDLLAPPASHPPDLFEWARRTFGPAQMGDEVYSMERPRVLRRLRDDLVLWTRRTTELALALMAREPWELCIVNLSATHRGGHKLWHTIGRDGGGVGGALEGALERVYAACDDAVGRLVERAEGATVIAFSLHGMGPNTSRIAILPEMLDRILTGRRQRANSPGLLQRLRGRIPNEWRSRVKSLLPLAVQDRLTIFWRLGDVDLHATPAFPLVADLQGYIRISVRGREGEGVVEPGAEYDRLCERIDEGLRSFVDAESGEPVVADIVRGDRMYAGGRRTADLPDLIVKWSERPAREHRVVVSPTYGSIDWPTPGSHPDGRTGNHRGEGFVIAAGDGIAPGSSVEGGHIVDLAPTVFRLLGLEPYPEWTGSPLAVAASP